MNGICIWHMGFTAKYNASFDLYQTVRNLHIAKATTGVLQNVDLLTDYKRKLRKELLSFNYPAVELLLRAMEDYLKGPEFIKQDLGEKIMKENAQKNEILRPLAEITDKFADLGLVFVDEGRTPLQRLIYGLTYNGQRFMPESMLKEDFVAIPFNGAYTPAKMFRHKNLLSINPDNRTAVMRTMDKDKFKSLLKRSKQVMKNYRKNNTRVMQEYRNARDELTSVEFWKKYLEIR